MIDGQKNRWENLWESYQSMSIRGGCFFLLLPLQESFPVMFANLFPSKIDKWSQISHREVAKKWTRRRQARVYYSIAVVSRASRRPWNCILIDQFAHSLRVLLETLIFRQKLGHFSWVQLLEKNSEHWFLTIYGNKSVKKVENKLINSWYSGYMPDLDI